MSIINLKSKNKIQRLKIKLHKIKQRIKPTKPSPLHKPPTLQLDIIIAPITLKISSINWKLLFILHSKIILLK